MDVDTERWRSYFLKAGVDIWTVIRHAILVAAIDFPQDFRLMRGEIAEALFARELVRSPSTHAQVETACTFEEVDAGKGLRQMVEMQAEGNGVADLGDDHLGRHHCMYCDEAEALADERGAECSVVDEVNIIKEACMGADQPEDIVYEGLHKLKYTNITVQVLEATEIAKKVKGLRKHPSARVSALAKELVSHWKRKAIEWIDAAEEAMAVTVSTATGTECGEISKDGLLSPPIDEDAAFEASTSPVDLSQLFSFIDDDMCGGQFSERETPVRSVEPCIKDKPERFALSQSGSILTDASYFDDNVHKWGLKMAEERGSATRDRIELCERGNVLRKEAKSRAKQDDDKGLMISNNAPKCVGPGRPKFDTRRVDFTSSTGNLTTESSSLPPKNVATHTKNSAIATMKSADANLADQKLAIAKRKLHKGYAEAENAKKQRTVQVLDVSDIPKSGQAVQTRVNSSARSKSGSQRGFLSRNGRHS